MSREAHGARRPVRAGRRSALAALALTGALGAGVAAAEGVFDDPFGTAQVGSQDAAGRILLPENQWIKPYGERTLVSEYGVDGRTPQTTASGQPVAGGRLTSSTLSPDGHRVAAMSWHNGRVFLTLIDPQANQVVQQVPANPTGAGVPRLGDGSFSPDGPLYSADGRALWVPQSTDILRFAVAPDGTVGPTPVVIRVPGNHPAPNDAAIPSGMALSPDGSKLYVALNGNNTLGIVDTATNTLEPTQIPVGNAPRQVVITGGEAFVSDEGGRPAQPGENTNNSYGTSVVADPATGATTTGAVSVVDLAGGRETGEIPTGLQPTALYLWNQWLFVANSNDDSVSIIDTSRHRVAQTFNVNPVGGVGSGPNAITMPDARHVLVSVGRNNAIEVFGIERPTDPVRLVGLIPTDWYPVNVQLDKAIGKIVVTNDKGIGSRGAPSTVNYPGDPFAQPPATNHNTYNDTGSVTTFAPPGEAQLGSLTHQVFVNNNWQRIARTGDARDTAAPRDGGANDQNGAAAGVEGLVHQLAGPGIGGAVVPTQIGAPSKIKHVFLIIKENRTYDQVFGDIGKGNSDPTLAQFGQRATPNQHALANRFGLFDNFYDPGTLSADGHNWLMQANANDYVEKEFAAFTRSYPAEGGDALAYARNGFLWNAAARAGRTVADFGEYAHFFNAPPPPAGPTWKEWYQYSQYLEGNAAKPARPTSTGQYQTYPDNIGSLLPILCKQYPQYALQVPDQYRIDIWERAFLNPSPQPEGPICHDIQYPKNGDLANLTLMRVPDDHTSGVGSGNPFPTAQVADNDKAVGRIVSDISHSSYWKDSAIFVVEDDPQNGVDHVDGHRSTALVISPYSRRGAVNSHYYTQLNVVRTIEQILGIQPMNQLDRAAVPMYDAFTNTPDLTPYDLVPSQVPLDLGVDATRPAAVAASAGAPASARAMIAKWVAWTHSQRHTGADAQADLENPAQLNRLDWYAATSWRRPYPGDRRILAPNQVPGRNRPANDIG